MMLLSVGAPLFWLRLGWEAKPEEYRLLRDLFVTKIGVYFGPDARFSLERRLRERVVALKLSTFAEYYQYLRFHPLAMAEWEEGVHRETRS